MDERGVSMNCHCRAASCKNCFLRAAFPPIQDTDISFDLEFRVDELD